MESNSFRKIIFTDSTDVVISLYGDIDSNHCLIYNSFGYYTDSKRDRSSLSRYKSTERYGDYSISDLTSIYYSSCYSTDRKIFHSIVYIQLGYTKSYCRINRVIISVIDHIKSIHSSIIYIEIIETGDNDIFIRGCFGFDIHDTIVRCFRSSS